MTAKALILSTFARPLGGGDVEWRISASSASPRFRGGDGSAGGHRGPKGRANLVWLLEHPPLDTSGTSGKAGDPPRPPLSPVRDRPRRPAHLSRPRPAGRLCDAGPEAAASGCARLRRGSGGTGSSGCCCLQRARRAPRGSAPPGLGQRPDKGAGYEDKIAAIGDGCGAGSRSTASPSMSSRSLSIFRRSAPGVADLDASPRWWISGLPVTLEDIDVALRRAFEDVFGPGKGGACRKPTDKARVTLLRVAVQSRAGRRCSGGLRQSAKAVGHRPFHFIDMRVAFVVQRPKQFVDGVVIRRRDRRPFRPWCWSR